MVLYRKCVALDTAFRMKLTSESWAATLGVHRIATKQCPNFPTTNRRVIVKLYQYNVFLYESTLSDVYKKSIKEKLFSLQKCVTFLLFSY